MIELNNISKIFYANTEREVVALQDINLKFTKGSFTILMGVNGSGKSTLMNVIAGSCKADFGNLIINGVNYSQKNEHEFAPVVSRIFQNPLLGTAPDLTLLQNFRLAELREHKKKLKIGITSHFRNTVKDKVATLKLGLENKLDVQMGNFSGGQRQALTLLMAVMQTPKLLLLDEPTAALDPRTAAFILKLTDQIIAEHQLTTILITHSLKDALQYGSSIILMQEGKVTKDLASTEKNKLQLMDLAEWFT